METNREELAWAAGFMDGEAHFGLVTTNRKTQNKHIHISVCQTEDGPLERLQKVLGCGTIYGPYKTKKSDGSARKPYKQFHINTFERVQHTVCLLWPWLSAPKRAQAKRMLLGYQEYQSRPKVKSGPKTDRRAHPPDCHPDRKCVSLGLCESCYRENLRARRNEQ